MEKLPDLESFLSEWSTPAEISAPIDREAYPPLLEQFVRLATSYNDKICEYRCRFVLPPMSWGDFNDDPWERKPPGHQNGWVVADYDCEVPMPVWCTHDLILSIWSAGTDPWKPIKCGFEEFAIGFILAQLYRNWPIRLDHDFVRPSNVEPFFTGGFQYSRWDPTSFFHSNGLLWTADGAYVCSKTPQIASRHHSWYRKEPSVT